MKLLLTNDDGISSPGIRMLEDVLHESFEIMTVAPMHEQSGASHSVTVRQPLIITQYESRHGISRYCVEGKPADCVAVTCKALSFSPDIVLSGINCGYNLGADIFYSGTFAAAMEGALFGIPAIAVSAENADPTVLFAAAKLMIEFLPFLKLRSQSRAMLYNINVPSDPCGAVYTALSPDSCTNTMRTMELRTDPRGRIYCWRPQNGNSDGHGLDNDRNWIQKNYITITPICTDLSDYSAIRSDRAECKLLTE